MGPHTTPSVVPEREEADGWVRCDIEEVVRNIVSLGVRDALRGKVLGRAESTRPGVQRAPMGKHENLVERMVELGTTRPTVSTEKTAETGRRTSADE